MMQHSSSKEPPLNTRPARRGGSEPMANALNSAPRPAALPSRPYATGPTASSWRAITGTMN